jgi:hypothetical protein
MQPLNVIVFGLHPPCVPGGLTHVGSQKKRRTITRSLRKSYWKIRQLCGEIFKDYISFGKLLSQSATCLASELKYSVEMPDLLERAELRYLLMIFMAPSETTGIPDSSPRFPLVRILRRFCLLRLARFLRMNPHPGDDRKNCELDRLRKVCMASDGKRVASFTKKIR